MKIMVNMETIMRQAIIEVYEYDMSIREEMDTKNRLVPYYIMSYLLGAAQLQRSGVNPETDNELFNTIFKFIVETEENDITLGLLANIFHLHPTYLSNRFEKYFDISPIALHRNILIDKAKNLLAVQQFSVTQVAEALGFASITVFSRYL